jgi:hypothetical protein
MTATILQFPTDYEKFSIQIASTGRVAELWEVRNGNRCARIARSDDGQFCWREYVAVKHRNPSIPQKLRPVTEPRKASSLLAAMTAAKAAMAAYNGYC